MKPALKELARPGIIDYLGGNSLTVPDSNSSTGWSNVRVTTLKPSFLEPRRRSLYVPADYNDTDASARVSQALSKHIPARKHRETRFVHVDSFATLSTSYEIAELGIHSPYPAETIIYSNTAPRGDKKTGGIQWEGEDGNDKQSFVFGVLDTGVPIFAVNTGYNLSLVRDHLVGLWEANVPDDGTQFRSLNKYPEALRILKGRKGRHLIGEELDPEKHIMAPPKVVELDGNVTANILYIDGRDSLAGYHNQKLHLTADQLPESVKQSQELVVTVNGHEKHIKNKLAGASVETGDLFLTQGSSGDPEHPWLEVNEFYGQSADRFGLRRVTDDTRITIAAA